MKPTKREIEKSLTEVEEETADEDNPLRVVIRRDAVDEDGRVVETNEQVIKLSEPSL
jgi:ketosteroid isomerase-like protein